MMNYLQKLFAHGPGMGDDAFHRQPESPEIQEAVDSLKRIKIITGSNPPRLAIPVFAEGEMVRGVQLYRTVTETIVNRFVSRMDDLKRLIDRCSFAGCPWSDVLCMLFHLSYSYAADKLVEEGALPEFPKKAGAEWGVWIH